MAPKHAFSDQLHAEKYRNEGESFDDAMKRIAYGLSDDSRHGDEFYDILSDLRFMPAGRVQSAIGSPKNVTPYNCFVSGTIHDSFVHGSGNAQDSIMDVAKQAAGTMRMGGGIGYDFSTLRPAKDYIEGVQSRTDGPLAFLPILDAVCKATSSAGNRRGAQMGVLRIDHPDIEEYITIKQPPEAARILWEHVDKLPADHPDRMSLAVALQQTLKLTGFNLSVAVTDEFMRCLEIGQPFPLQFGGKTYRYIDPRYLWERIMRSTWDWAEPGVLFIDTINKQNNLWYCETIAATNPCGEQPLPPFGACLLGSFNLTKYVRGNGPFWFDWAEFISDIPTVVRAMDNVVDRASYPLPEQAAEARSKRRMGLGVTGEANAIEAMLGEAAYGSDAYLQMQDTILRTLTVEAYRASVQLAIEKGSFPAFNAELYSESLFIRKLPKDLQDDIRRYGIRNSHLTSIAPTGSISLSADNISSGIEPVFELEVQRRVKMVDGDKIVTLKDYGLETFGVAGRTAGTVTAQEHVKVLAGAAKWMDSAVSKTCNVSPDMPWDDFKQLYVDAWKLGAKGITTFNSGGKRLGIFIAKEQPTGEEGEGQACEVDFATGRRSCE